MANSEPTTLEDFHAGRASRFAVNVDPKEGTDGRSIWTATVATEDGVKLAVCEADSPSAAMAGATTAANDSLARIHLAGRIGSEELQEKLGIETLADGVTRILSQAS